MRRPYGELVMPNLRLVFGLAFKITWLLCKLCSTWLHHPLRVAVVRSILPPAALTALAAFAAAAARRRSPLSRVAALWPRAPKLEPDLSGPIWGPEPEPDLTQVAAKDTHCAGYILLVMKFNLLGHAC